MLTCYLLLPIAILLLTPTIIDPHSSLLQRSTLTLGGDTFASTVSISTDFSNSNHTTYLSFYSSLLRGEDLICTCGISASRVDTELTLFLQFVCISYAHIHLAAYTPDTGCISSHHTR